MAIYIMQAMGAELWTTGVEPWTLAAGFRTMGAESSILSIGDYKRPSEICDPICKNPEQSRKPNFSI